MNLDTATALERARHFAQVYFYKDTHAGLGPGEDYFHLADSLAHQARLEAERLAAARKAAVLTLALDYLNKGQPENAAGIIRGALGLPVPGPAVGPWAVEVWSPRGSWVSVTVCKDEKDARRMESQLSDGRCTVTRTRLDPSAGPVKFPA